MVRRLITMLQQPNDRSVKKKIESRKVPIRESSSHRFFFHYFSLSDICLFKFDWLLSGTDQLISHVNSLFVFIILRCRDRLLIIAHFIFSFFFFFRLLLLFFFWLPSVWFSIVRMFLVLLLFQLVKIVGDISHFYLSLSLFPLNFISFFVSFSSSLSTESIS